MAKDPAFLFYSSDFLTGVSDLTFEERGQYITLLCLHHQKGRLSKKVISIAIQSVSADVMSKFKKDKKGFFYNERLEEEAKKRAEHSEKQRNRALDGWKKRRAQSDTTANATALPLESVNENENRVINAVPFEKSEKLLPTIEEFLTYAEEITGVAFYKLKPSLILKFESWKVNDWHTGGKKSRKIKNWKNTLANTIPYLKPTDDNTPVMLADKMRQDAGIK